MQGQGEEKRIAVALNQQRHIFARACQRAAEARFVVDADLTDGEDFVAAFESGTFRRAADAGNNQAAFACTFIDAQGQSRIIDGKAVRRICLLRLLGSA